MDDLPQTLLEAVRYFCDLDICHHYMRRIKWPDGKIACPHCESDSIGEIATRRLLKCRDCKKQFSVKVGTIFEDSPLPLGHWLTAVWSEAAEPVSSVQLADALGIAQKSAWAMQSRIRAASALTH